MTRVIYADILLIVNTYVNYALLRLTSVICRKKTKIPRLIFSSVLGSLYSFIILADRIPGFAVAGSKFAFAAVMVAASFKVCGKKDFIRLFTAFFLVSFAFAGLMFALWWFFAPDKMFFENGIVYFDINTFTLLVLTMICYSVIKLGEKYISFKAPKNTIFEIRFSLFGHCFEERAFLDTGNSLKEPFSSLPVIIAYDKIKSTDERKKPIFELFSQNEETLRYIPVTTVREKCVLKAAKAEDVRIKGVKTDIMTDDVYIALSDKKIHGGDFAVLLNCEIFERETDHV